MIALLLILQSDVEIRAELGRRAAELEQQFLPGVKTAEDFEKLRPRLREEYFYMLGLSPMPEKTPLQAKTTGRREFDTYIVENVHFQSRPGLYVTANLYLPKAPGRHPAIVYQSGHANKGRDGNKSAYQDHGIWLASHGFVCLTTDTLQLGEIGAIHHGTYREQRWWWHDRGYTSAGVECWNGIRAVDYLLSRPEVDGERLGATGISGGGAATFWLAAADERIKAAAPVSGMADLGYYVGQDGVNGHCDCMFLHNTFRWNWTTIAALVCPRPMAFVNSDDDKIFPMSANERVSNRLEHLYARFGVSDKFETFVSIGGHAYRADLRRSIFEFFKRTLKGDASPVVDSEMGLAAPIPGKDLRVFPDELPADQLNTRIDETFVPLGKPGLPEEGQFEAWRKPLVESLQRIVLGPDMPILKNNAFGPKLKVARVGSRMTQIVLSHDESVDEIPGWAASHAPEKEGVLLHRTRGGWTQKNPPNTVERSLVLLGRTVDADRTAELLVAAHGPVPTERFVGRGNNGILGAYAALISPQVREIVLIDPPASHKDGPHFLNVLRVLDIPEALGCLAPRKLVLVNAKDPAFDRTVEIYRRAGAADKIERR